MHKRVVTTVIVVGLLLGLGLMAHLINGPGGPGASGLGQMLRKAVHGN